jgi:hypothetical protein
MLDDPIVGKVLHGEQAGAIVVDPETGACVGIIDWRIVRTAFPYTTFPDNTFLGHLVAEAMQPMREPRAHEFKSKAGGISYVTGRYQECIACRCVKEIRGYKFNGNVPQSVHPICFGPL